MIYLDANATSKMRPEAAETLAQISREDLGNPSSVHEPGRRARALLREAAESILRFCDCDQGELIFTSGGTEACNTLVYGFTEYLSNSTANKGHIISSSIEHPSILKPLYNLENYGWEISWLNPSKSGIVSPENFVKELKANTRMVVLMAANNETGAIQPVAEVASLLRKNGYKGVIVSDTTQAFGKKSFSGNNYFTAGINAFTLSGHKLGCPTGIGALIFNPDGPHPTPLISGGPQQAHMRAGTENIHAAYALGTTLQSLKDNITDELKEKKFLRDLLWKELSSNCSNIQLISPSEDGLIDDNFCLANTILVRFPEYRGPELVAAFDLLGLAVSSGSACSSGVQTPSHVLKNMGFSEAEAVESVRFSIDWCTAEADIYNAAKIIKAALSRKI